MESENNINTLTCGDFLKTRRTFLSTALLAVGGYAMSSSELSAATRKHGVDLQYLPMDWVRCEGGQIFRYAKYIKKLHLKHINPQDIIAVHARHKGEVWNSIPPKQYWKNIGETLKVADTVAKTLKEDVKKVVSLYRSPAYNARCPGAKPHSWHQKNVAMDIVMESCPREVYSLAKYYRDNRNGFEGGVGLYPDFTHIDTRGYKATW